MMSSRLRSLTSIYDARRLLQIDDTISSRSSKPISKDDIQQAFVRSAQRHHPDRRHHLGAEPCPIRFRNCVQARDLLLNHYYGPSPNRPSTPCDTYANPGWTRGRRTSYTNSNPNQHQDSFAKGFPFRTLRLLTLKQKLTIRGTIMAFVCAAAGYDKWIRMENRRVSQSKN